MSASPPVISRSRFSTWLMAALLGVATLVLYWPTMRHGFINYDDDVYVTANLQVQKGLTGENLSWAFTHPVCANWHPLTMLSHMTDCQIFGLKPWRTPPDQHLAARAQHHPGLSVFTGLYRYVLAERIGGRIVRVAPAARGIGRLGSGTKGCVKRLLRFAHTYFLLPVRPDAISSRKSGAHGGTGTSPHSQILNPQLLAGSALVRAGFDEQADAGDVAVRLVVVGLLATAPFWICNA